MTETCVHCGRSVAFGSGLYVDRIPVLDNMEEKKESYEYPEGEFCCIECEKQWYKENPQFECKKCGHVDYIDNMVDGKCTIVGCESTDWVKIDPED